jgi:hypothetical protein
LLSDRESNLAAFATEQTDSVDAKTCADLKKQQNVCISSRLHGALVLHKSENRIVPKRFLLGSDEAKKANSISPLLVGRIPTENNANRTDAACKVHFPAVLENATS